MERPDLAGLAVELTPPPGSRIAIVGGCGGFGRELVTACLGHDLEVAVLDLDQSIERHRPRSDVALVLPFDATEGSSVDDAFSTLASEWEQLDALMFLVGFTLVPPAPLAGVPPEAWDEVLAGNLRSAYLTARAALPMLERSQSAAIVTVSSGLAYAPLPGFGPYAAAKAGLIALTKSLAVECAPVIRANAVAPSAALTAFMGGGTGRGGDDGDPDWFDAPSFAQRSPMGRLCEPQDIVGPMLFLAGPGSRYMTGQVLHVNGGKLTP